MDKELFLAYIDKIGINSENKFEYEFYFSETPDTVWGEDWNEQCPSACEDLRPEEDTYSCIFRLVTDIPLFCAQENSCFSMQDCIDGCICLAMEDISEMDEYPEPYRLVFSFAETYDDVCNKLEGRENYFIDDKKEEQFA